MLHVSLTRIQHHCSNKPKGTERSARPLEAEHPPPQWTMWVDWTVTNQISEALHRSVVACLKTRFDTCVQLTAMNNMYNER
jgi:hypothetical protein